MITIASVPLATPLILAPLAGYSDIPFRLLCRSYGAGLCVSEMISCHGVVYRQNRTLQLAAAPAEDRPLSLQLFGSDPAIMGEAAAMLDALRPDLIDINMGCPVKKVTKRGAGAALMASPRLAESIVERVIQSCSCPVTVKIRSGPDHGNLNAVPFARMLEDAGAAAVTVHGRTWKQAFSGHADWSVIAAVAAVLKIPVIGNGDIFSYADALDKQDRSGCAAVMIGRAALGNPWVFQAAGKPTAVSQIACGVLHHLALIERHLGNPPPCLGGLKNHLGRYFRGFGGSAKLRQRIYQQPTWQGLRSLLEEIAGSRAHPFGQPAVSAAAGLPCG